MRKGRKEEEKRKKGERGGGEKGQGRSGVAPWEYRRNRGGAVKAVGSPGLVERIGLGKEQ